jgi:hypothetical protein
MRNRQRCRGLRPSLDALDDRCLLSMLTPAQVTNAYGLDSVSFRAPSGSIIAADGSGETIALIEAYHDPTLRFDLHSFDQANYLSDPSLTVVNQAGAKTSSPWASEESLDVEWAHAIAPGAGILVVEARSQAFSDLISAVNTARQTPGVVAVSMSWGFGETSHETSFDVTFTTPAGHAGITFVASSGDGGFSSGAEYPAASPNVLAVGGTTLNLDAAGDYLSEAAWTDSGGGPSEFEAEPGYQDAVQASGRRRTPDVAFDGDPSTGVEVYETALGTGQGSWEPVGGTSLGAPAWAAIIAIADQGRALAGKGSLDGPTQTLPTLYALPAIDFHTVAARTPASPWGGGINPVGFLPLGGILARHRGKPVTGPSHGTRPVANTAAGLGSPNAPPLIADLIASTISIPLASSTAIPSSTQLSLARRPRGRNHRHSSAHGHAMLNPQAFVPAWAKARIPRIRQALPTDSPRSTGPGMA